MEKLEYSDIYGLRTLVFVEKEPQSNKYFQVLLSPEMFKNMTATISKPTGRKLESGSDEHELQTSEEEYDLPDLPEAYSNL